VDVRLTPEQEALRDATARLVDRLAPRAVADLADEERSGKLNEAVEAANWRDLRSESPDGGPWATAVEAALVAEQLGAGLADTSFLGPTLAADLGRMLGRPASENATIALTGDLGYLGREVAADATGASVALAAGRQEFGTGQQVVEVQLGPVIDGVDLTRAWRHAGDDGPPLGIVPWEEMTRWTALGLALSAADLCGIMRGALGLSVRYASDRRQYGQAIGSFQVVQHLLADSLVAVEGAWSTTLYAAWSVDACPPDEALAAGAAAKAFCARAALASCETAIQVHGGIGNTWECLAHLYLRRGLVSSEMFGGVARSLQRVLGRRGIGEGDGLR
jgi:alkylation response protein AidB-like acyl-CoA dehydrogenase